MTKARSIEGPADDRVGGPEGGTAHSPVRPKQRVSGLATLSEEPALTYGVRWSTTFVCHRVFPRANVTVAERALPVMCSRHVKTSHARKAAQPKFTR
jgi:hypothetical protein